MSVTERVLAALSDHDLEAFLACYAPDATIEDGFDAVLAAGHAGMRARYGPMFEEFPDARWTLLERIDAGSFVVQHEEITGRGDTTRHVCVYLVKDDRIERELVLR